ncbi:hypothetical protein DRV84_08425 [Rhodosalinus sediminis]|uniref:DUF6538 domain-containing protein n=1 Tax=Rhodosalinus sediminis TaxID=1940533 RepID=A0A3D9BUA3_9RHOB|nr:hypothetical protein DRV84_08425 [Rhodosalinus sediminis]
MPLIMRGGTWHLRRRMPVRFAEVEPRREVWVSLKTDARLVAARTATAVWEGLIGGREAQLASRSDDAATRLAVAREIAARRGLT